MNVAGYTISFSITNLMGLKEIKAYMYELLIINIRFVKLSKIKKKYNLLGSSLLLAKTI